LRTLVERHLDHHGPDAAASYVNLERRTGGGQGHRNVRHAYGLLQERRLRAGGDVTDLAVALHHPVTVPRDSAVHHLEPDELPLQPGLLLRAQRVETNEVVLLPADD